MTRWVAQTTENYVSVLPYNHTYTTIHGFQGTHQPAIWMGESGQVVVTPGVGTVQSTFDDRGLDIVYDDGGRREAVSVSYYAVDMEAPASEGGGTISAEMSASEWLLHISPRMLTRDTYP